MPMAPMAMSVHATTTPLHRSSAGRKSWKRSCERVGHAQRGGGSRRLVGARERTAHAEVRGPMMSTQKHPCPASGLCACHVVVAATCMQQAGRREQPLPTPPHRPPPPPAYDRTLSSTMTRPRMSCPVEWPKPHSAPSAEAVTRLRPMVRGVSACTPASTTSHAWFRCRARCVPSRPAACPRGPRRRRCDGGGVPLASGSAAATGLRTARWSGPQSVCRTPAARPVQALFMADWMPAGAPASEQHATCHRCCSELWACAFPPACAGATRAARLAPYGRHPLPRSSRRLRCASPRRSWKCPQAHVLAGCSVCRVCVRSLWRATSTHARAPRTRGGGLSRCDAEAGERRRASARDAAAEEAPQRHSGDAREAALQQNAERPPQAQVIQRRCTLLRRRRG